MAARLGIAALLMLASFITGIKVNDWRRDSMELKRAQIAQVETRKAIEANFRAGEQLSKVIAREQVVTKNVREVVREYIPSDDKCPSLPNGWRVLHDAAAEGIDPSSAGNDDPGPTPQDAAETVAENYGACRINAARLTALQDYVRTQVAGK